MYSFGRNAVVVASAGTGKTHALVGVLLHVLLGETELGDVQASRVVATTFSRRAAREIRSRLGRELERLSEAPDTSAYWAELQRTRAGRGLEAATSASVMQKAREASRGASEVFVGTLHGFALSVLRGFALEVARPGGIEVADEAEVRARASRAIAQAIEEHAKVHAERTRALVGLSGGLEGLVTKLRVVFESFEELGVRARDLRVATDDARVLERRWEELVALVQAVAPLPRYTEVAQGFAALGRRSDPELALDALARLGAVKKSPKPAATEAALHAFVEGLRGDTKRRKLEQLYFAYEAREAFASESHVLLELLSRCERGLEVARREGAGLGFGEILGELERLLVTRPDIAEEIGARYDVLLVDEFQDTSRLQKRLVELLWARPSARTSGREIELGDVRPTGLFVVGDRKQSIYGFRGADVSVFAELCVGLAAEPAREKLRVDKGAIYTPPEPTADFFPLRTNRRSPAELLAFINAFSARVFADDVEKRELFELEYAPEIEDLLAPAAPAPTEAEPRPAPPRAVWLKPPLPERGASTRRSDARAVTSVIRDLVGGRRPSALPGGAPPRYMDCAVLALTNDMLDEMAYSLAEANVPYVLAGKSFYRAREVLDLAAMLSLLVDPADRLAALAVFRGSFAGVSDASLLAMTDPGHGLRRVDRALLEGPRAGLVVEEERPRIAHVVELVLGLGRLLPRVGPGAALREAVRALRLEETLAALPRGRGKVANLRKFLSMADAEPDARALVARVLGRAGGTDDEGEAATFSEEDDAVRLLTVHASKGLDFEIVFVPQMGATVLEGGRGSGPLGVERTARGVFVAPRIAHVSGAVLDSPAYERTRAMAVRRDRAERKRLLYVAMTRASCMLFPVGSRRPPKKAAESHATSGVYVLEALAASAARETFAVEEIDVESIGADAVTPRLAGYGSSAPPSLGVPSFRTLPIAPTSLQDFFLCPRRFELVHLLALPEHAHLARGRGAARARVGEPEVVAVARSGSAAERSAAPAELALRLDAQAEGTRMHRVLERLDVGLLGQARTLDALSAALAHEGIPVEHPRHAALARRLSRFVSGRWLTGRVARGATVQRELAFAVHVPVGEGRTALFRGSMDLVLSLDGEAGPEIEVVDYKRARGPELLPYELQLELYALAARSLFPSARSVRAGVVFLGGDPGQPVWLPEVASDALEGRVTETVRALSEARWLRSFPRVALPRCEAISCGYVGRCHPKASPSDDA